MGARLIDKDFVFKAGQKFERVVRGEVQHTLEVVKTKDGLRFKVDGATVYPNIGAAARGASGWANANPYHYWNPANGKAPRKPLAAMGVDQRTGIADTAQVVAEPIIAIDEAAVVAGPTAPRRRVTRPAKPAAPANAATGTGKAETTRQQRVTRG